MSLPLLANGLTALFCLAVLVQSVRLMRAVRAMRDGALTDMVAKLDQSTREARTVVTDLKAALSACAEPSRLMAGARELADELGVMVGIADATAERLVAVAADASRTETAVRAAGAAGARAPRRAPRRAAAGGDAPAGGASDGGASEGASSEGASSRRRGSGRAGSGRAGAGRARPGEAKAAAAAAAPAGAAAAAGPELEPAA